MKTDCQGTFPGVRFARPRVRGSTSSNARERRGRGAYRRVHGKRSRGGGGITLRHAVNEGWMANSGAAKISASTPVPCPLQGIRKQRGGCPDVNFGGSSKGRFLSVLLGKNGRWCTIRGIRGNKAPTDRKRPFGVRGREIPTLRRGVPTKDFQIKPEQ